MVSSTSESCPPKMECSLELGYVKEISKGMRNVVEGTREKQKQQLQRKEAILCKKGLGRRPIGLVFRIFCLSRNIA